MSATIAADEEFTQGLARQQAGDVAAAIALYRKALAGAPDHPGANHYLGMALYQQGKAAAALPLVEKSVRLAPRDAGFRGNLGIVLLALGRASEAETACAEAVRLDPRFATAYHTLGQALLALGQPDVAVEAFRRATALRPDMARAWNNLGLALRRLDRNADGIAAFRRAVELSPNLAEAHNNLANAQGDAGEHASALTAYLRALDLRPNDAGIYANLGATLLELGRFDEAATACKRAIALENGQASAHWNLAHVLLLTGRLAEGWAEYEWRWRLPDFPSPRRDFAAPQWDGSALAGRTLLVHAEQGFGDAIQFARYVPQLRRRHPDSGPIVLECGQPLARLLAGLDGVSQVVVRGEPLPDFDLHVPLLSLPGLFGTTLADIPGTTPYLQADPAGAARWREIIGDGPRLRVGLAWAGNPRQKYVAQKTLAKEHLALLLAVEGVRFFGLQVGASAKDIEWLAARGMTDISLQLADFAETAAVLANLDLVIAADTVVAHLAGALDRPAWVMLNKVPDWRWLTERGDSPWYSSLRLFRQEKTGDWATVVARVAAELRGKI